MVVRAVRAALKEERFANRFSLEVHDLRSDRGTWAETRFPFGNERHGFAVVNAAGDMLACRPGHNYGAAEIEHDLGRIADTGSAWPRTDPKASR